MTRPWSTWLSSTKTSLAATYEATRPHLGSEESEVAELEVGPEVAHVVLPVMARDELHHVILRDEIGVAVHELPRMLPQRRDGGRSLQHRDGETILDASACTEAQQV